MLVQRKIPMWEKKLLEQKVKELKQKKLLEQKVKEVQQKLEDQERIFERFRVILTEEMKEKDDLLRKMNERIQMLEVCLVWVWAVTLEQSLNPQEGMGEK